MTPDLRLWPLARVLHTGARTLTHSLTHARAHSLTHTHAHTLRSCAYFQYAHAQVVIHTMSHHHTYYVTSSYILCHIIHTMSHHHTYYVTSYILCHIIICTCTSCHAQIYTHANTGFVLDVIDARTMM
jgi:hypothetical protein